MLGIYYISGFFGLITTFILYINKDINNYTTQRTISSQFTKFDIWAFGHFCLYFLLGILYPNYWILIILNSIFWELFEFYVPFMIGNWFDLVINFIAYYIGSKLI